MNIHVNPNTPSVNPCILQAEQFIELLTGSIVMAGSKNTPVQIRFLDDRKHQGFPERGPPDYRLNYFGTIAELWPTILERQADGWGVGVVVNAGGTKTEQITKINANFIDSDGKPRPADDKWHHPPSFAVMRNEMHWHAYWTVTEQPVDMFKPRQKQLADRYGTDHSMSDLPQVMRLAGTLWLKGEQPQLYRLVVDQRWMRESWYGPMTPDEVDACLPSVQPKPQATTKPDFDWIRPVAGVPPRPFAHGEARAFLDDGKWTDRSVGAFAFIAECKRRGYAPKSTVDLMRDHGDAHVMGHYDGDDEKLSDDVARTWPKIEDTDNAELDRLARLPVFDYEREREVAAQRLSIGRIKTLDDEVKRRRAELNANSEVGFLQEPEPWPEPVNAHVLLDELVETIKAYVILPDDAASAAALWLVHAHAHDAASISPILAVESPEKRCGKTTLVQLLGELAPKALALSNITAASLYRTIEAYKPTLLIDEADTFLSNNEELRGVLNSGHNKRTASVVRLVGDGHEPKVFSTWAPKAIAMIGELPDTLRDRSIIVRMRRKMLHEKVCRLRLDRVEDLTRLRSMAWRWAQDNIAALSKADPTVPQDAGDRAADNWRVLLAIADLAGGHWPNTARTAAGRLAKGPDDGDDTNSVRLLADIRAIFDQTKKDALTPKDLQAKLNEDQEGPWAEQRHGWGISTRAIAKLLKPYGIKSTDPQRRGYKSERYYKRVDFADAWARYLGA